MKTTLAFILIPLLLLAVPTSAQDANDSLQPPPPDRPPSPERLGADRDAQPPRPPMDTDRRPAPPGRRGRPDLERTDRPGPFPQPPWAPLMRILRQRRPELAERLEHMRRQDPDLFERVLLDAFIPRIERALEEAEADLAQRHEGRVEQPRRPGRPGRLDQPGPERELERHFRELQERQEQLQVRSHELAERFRRLREEDAQPEERAALREELAGVVNAQFDVRTELREIELHRVERELQRLQEHIERMRHEFERRQQERGPIIERRVMQLLGEDFGGW